MLFGEVVELLDDGALLRSVWHWRQALDFITLPHFHLAFLYFLSVIEYMSYQFSTLAIAVMTPLS